MTPVTRNPELERFKVDIDLRAYAADQGCQLRRKECWRGSAVMKHEGTNDKIVIKRDLASQKPKSDRQTPPTPATAPCAVLPAAGLTASTPRKRPPSARASLGGGAL